ncbi:MAG: Hsp20/alpha crystallin family protein [Vicingaceae bacterium]
MSLIKKNLSTFPSLAEFFDDDWLSKNEFFKDWKPAVNVEETDKNFEIEMVAPGFDKDDFNVSVENGVLTIQAKSQKEEEHKKKKFTRKEFSYKSFEKSFTLPENVNADDIDATYKRGLLKLVIPKIEQKTSDKKQVKVS